VPFDINRCLGFVKLCHLDEIEGRKIRGPTMTLSANPGTKARCKRWRVTDSETSFLEAVFLLRTRKPSRATIEHLAGLLAVRSRQIQVWFQNRRQRWRKEYSEEDSAAQPGVESGGDEDTLQPASLEAMMHRFIGVEADAARRGGGGGGGGGGSIRSDDQMSCARDDEAPGSSNGDETVLELEHDDAHAAQYASPRAHHVAGSNWSATESTVGSAAEEAYLDHLAKLIDTSAYSVVADPARGVEDELDGDIEAAKQAWSRLDWFVVPTPAAADAAGAKPGAPGAAAAGAPFGLAALDVLCAQAADVDLAEQLLTTPPAVDPAHCAAHFKAASSRHVAAVSQWAADVPSGDGAPHDGGGGGSGGAEAEEGEALVRATEFAGFLRAVCADLAID
jgi:hypothetical protein